MLEAVLLDNDVILKMCAYASAARLLQLTTLANQPPVILEVASFALRSQIQRSRSISDKEGAASQLALVLSTVHKVEPTDQEVGLAAELEEQAQQRALELDPGESQLVAVLLVRGSPLLITGDKRALNALASVAPKEAGGRMACLEQAMASAIAGEGNLAALRSAVCACPQIDRAVTNCFACSSESVTIEAVMEGLRSYVGALRAQAGRLLIGSDDLVAIPSQEDRVRFV